MAPARPAAFVVVLLGVVCPPPASAQTFQNVIFHANLHEHNGYSDIWGYTAPNGDEYALLGTWNGLSVVNVSDPPASYEADFLPGPFSRWRDIKTYQNWAYVTNEAGGGLAIIDLTDPENPVPRPNYSGFSRAHNLFIDEASALCYIAGSDLGVGGLRILSLADPENPVEVGSWEIQYVHDVAVRGGRAYCASIFNSELVILDVTTPSSIPAPIGSVSGYPSAFTHNAWMTDDNQFVMTTDETIGASVRMWDLSNPASIVQTDSYRPNPAGSPHNVLVDGKLAFISHYTAGVRIVDVSDPFAITELAWYDTFPANDGGTFEGCWGVFPFFQSDQELFVASDIQTGLYVLEYRGVLGTVSGQVTMSGNPAQNVAGARVEVVESGVAVLADSTGSYSLLDAAGAVTLQVSAFGYETATVPVTIGAGTTATVDIALVQVPSGSVSGLVLDALTALPLPGAVIDVIGTPLSAVANAAGFYAHAAVPSGLHTVEASAFGYDRLRADVTATAGGSLPLDFPLTRSLASDDFEAANGAWTVSGNATTGQWERADPEGTTDLGQPIQPEDDHTANGTDCWVTGPLAGAAVGHHDVDGGETVLTSPVFDATVLALPRVSYWRWYSTGLGNPSTDEFTVEISSDAGGSWKVLETVAQPRTQWSLVDVAIDSLVVPSSQVQFRFTARDTGAGSITEAAIDDFMVYDTQSVVGTTVPPGTFGGGSVSLSQSYPNPSRPGETVRLALALPARTRIHATIHDIAGRRVATLAQGMLPAGPHQLRWDGRRENGAPAAAGVYFLRFESGAGTQSRKLVLLR